MFAQAFFVLVLMQTLMAQSAQEQILNCAQPTTFIVSTLPHMSFSIASNGALTMIDSTGPHALCAAGQTNGIYNLFSAGNPACTTSKFQLKRFATNFFVNIIGANKGNNYVLSFGSLGSNMRVNADDVHNNPDYQMSPGSDPCKFFQVNLGLPGTGGPPPPPPPPPPPVPGPGPQSACQKDLKNCPNFFKCTSDADCPPRDWTCAPDVKSCVLRTESVALQSYIRAGHKDPFTTATAKRSFVPGNHTEELVKRGGNFWPAGHGEAAALSVFAQYAYQDNVKTLGGGQGLCSTYTILDTFTSTIFGLESIIYSNAKGYYILAFKGTNSIAETIVDIDAVPKHFADVTRNGNSEIHSGFYTAYNQLRGKFMNVLGPLKQTGKLRKFSITGHSLGAAMAQIATLDLTYRGFTVEFNYNFGCPRVGNQAFQSEYAQATPRVQKAFLSLSYWYSDPIPHLPLTFVPFLDGTKPVFYADPPNFYFVDCKPTALFGDGCKADTLHNSDRYATNLKRLAGGAACYDLPQPTAVTPPPPPPGPPPPPKPVPGPGPGPGGQCTYKKP